MNNQKITSEIVKNLEKQTNYFKKARGIFEEVDIHNEPGFKDLYTNMGMAIQANEKVLNHITEIHQDKPLSDMEQSAALLLLTTNKSLGEKINEIIKEINNIAEKMIKNETPQHDIENPKNKTVN